MVPIFAQFRAGHDNHCGDGTGTRGVPLHLLTLGQHRRREEERHQSQYQQHEEIAEELRGDEEERQIRHQECHEPVGESGHGGRCETNTSTCQP